MSHKEIRELSKLKWTDKSVADLQGELRKHKDRSFELRFEQVTGKLTNFREILLNKRRIAVLQTLIRQMELGAAGKEAK